MLRLRHIQFKVNSMLGQRIPERTIPNFRFAIARAYHWDYGGKIATQASDRSKCLIDTQSDKWNCQKELVR